jgi:hypothetical protein
VRYQHREGSSSQVGARGGAVPMGGGPRTGVTKATSRGTRHRRSSTPCAAKFVNFCSRGIPPSSLKVARRRDRKSRRGSLRNISQSYR